MRAFDFRICEFGNHDAHHLTEPTAIQEQRPPFGTTEMIFVEFATRNTGDYQCALSLESMDAKRYVSLTASCHGPPGTSDIVDQQFDELWATLDAVLSSLKFDPKKQ